MIVDTYRGIRFSSYDDAEQIACCLHCTLPDCRNCIVNDKKPKKRTGKSRGRPKGPTDTHYRVAELSAQGLRPFEIAERLGIDGSVVCYHLRRIGGKTKCAKTSRNV